MWPFKKGGVVDMKVKVSNEPEPELIQRYKELERQKNEDLAILTVENINSLIKVKYYTTNSYYSSTSENFCFNKSMFAYTTYEQADEYYSEPLLRKLVLKDGFSVYISKVDAEELIKIIEEK